MYFPDANNIIASWQGKHTLHAVKEAEGTVFCLEYKELETISYCIIRDIRGWVAPDEIGSSRRKKFYHMLRPIFSSDNSALIFGLFVKKIYGEMRGKAVGFLEKKRFCVEFFPKEGPSFPIQKTEGFAIPSYWDVVCLSSSWLWSKEAIDACSEVTLRDSFFHFQSITSHIVVRTPTSGMKVIQTEMHVLVKHIREEIEKMEGIPPDKQRLMFMGKQLDNDESTLADNSIRSGFRLDVVLRLRGGGLDLTTFNKMENLIYDSGNHLLIRSGLNLEGKCKNEKCEKSGQVIWIWMGFGVFNLNKECGIATCPQCKESAIDVNNCGFTRCIYSIEGVTELGEKREQLDIRAPDDDLLTYDSGGPTQKWRTLTITTKYVPVAESSSSPELPFTNSLSSLGDSAYVTPSFRRKGGNCSGCVLF